MASRSATMSRPTPARASETAMFEPRPPAPAIPTVPFRRAARTRGSRFAKRSSAAVPHGGRGVATSRSASSFVCAVRRTGDSALGEAIRNHGQEFVGRNRDPFGAFSDQADLLEAADRLPALHDNDVGVGEETAGEVFDIRGGPQEDGRP